MKVAAPGEQLAFPFMVRRAPRRPEHCRIHALMLIATERVLDIQQRALWADVQDGKEPRCAYVAPYAEGRPVACVSCVSTVLYGGDEAAEKDVPRHQVGY